jgi:hypothetical protein
MRYAMVTLLFMTSTVATVALAQDGGGRGPPQSIIIVPQPTVPTTASTTVPVPKLLPPKLELPAGLTPTTK